MPFKLHENFRKKEFVADLPLCRILLEDESYYPWVLLIPRRPDASKIMDLQLEDQLLLLKELDITQKILWETFHPTQLNVAAIGNKTPQLHVHVIARFSQDPAWPHTVWDHPARLPYSTEARERVLDLFRSKYNSFLEKS